jgi:urea transporter
MAAVSIRWPGAKPWASEFLRTYAQVFLAHSPWVGLLLLLATATQPATLACGVLAVVTASLAARALGLEDGLRASGYHGYNALLVGVGVGHLYATGWLVLAVVGLASTVTVVLTAATRAWLTRRIALPVLSLPFLAVFWLVIGAAPVLELAPAWLAAEPLATTAAPPTWSMVALLADYARCLGSILFMPTVAAGALVALALLLHSRIASLFAFGTFVLLVAVNAALPSPLPMPLVSVLAANATLLSITIGGVWFLPSRWSILWACAATLACMLVTAGLSRPFAAAGVPLLFVPFNLLSFAVLLAARERVRDGKPKSIDFLPGSPEENLDYVLNQHARFPLSHGMRLQLPFRGRWTCTQAVDGKHTHQGPWRYGFDFQVVGDDGELFTGAPSELTNYHCYKLPVLAPAGGIVVKVENDIADNPVGEMDLVHNWGNVVVVQHGPGLYSLVAHLARRSIKVKEGQQVVQGEVLGLCGNSGRSPTPHIHFHLQAGPHLGATTLPVAFGDVVMAASIGERLEIAHVPAEGDVCRNLEPSQDLAERLRLGPGDEWMIDRSGVSETVTVSLNLVGQTQLQSSRAASLVTTRTPQMLILHDVVGQSESVLALLRAAMPRVPFEDNASLLWKDHVRAHRALGWPWFARLWAHLVPHPGLTLRYTLRKDGDCIIVDGVSFRTDKQGVPVLRTRVVFAGETGPLSGPLSINVRHGRGEVHAVRLTAPEAAGASAPGLAAPEPA